MLAKSALLHSTAALSIHHLTAIKFKPEKLTFSIIEGKSGKPQRHLRLEAIVKIYETLGIRFDVFKASAHSDP